MPQNTVSSKFSLIRLSLVMGFLGLLSLGTGLGLERLPDYQSLAEILRVAGLVLLGMAITALTIERRQQLYGFSQTRQARFGANAIVLSLSFVGVVILLNYLGYRHPQRWDLTQNKSFTLSEQTTKILKNLKSKLKITAFYTVSNSMRQEMVNLLETYREQAGEQLEFVFIDPERQPALAMRYGNILNGSIVLEQGATRKTIQGTQEQDLTNAILAITRETKPVLRFLQGHGELNPEDYDVRQGLSVIKQVLDSEHYQSEKFYLQDHAYQVPKDTAVLVIAGPEKPLAAEERKAVQEYLNQNGRVLLTLRPRVQSGLESLLAQYGVVIGNNLVIDTGRNIQNDVSAPAITEYAFHPVTKEMRGAITFFPLVRTVELKKPPAGVTGTELFKSSAQSWAETNLKENNVIKKEPGEASGPLSLAVALSIEKQPAATDKSQPTAQKKNEARLVVLGNTTFASNGFSRLVGNSDLFLNSLAWLAEQDDLIAIRPKDKASQQLELTNGQNQLVFYLSVVGMPLLMLLFGFGVWWKRR